MLNTIKLALGCITCTVFTKVWLKDESDKKQFCQCIAMILPKNMRMIVLMLGEQFTL